MIPTATSNNRNAFVTPDKGQSGNSALVDQASSDPVDSLARPMAIISFGGDGVSMEQLAKCVIRNPDGTTSFNFTSLPDVVVREGASGPRLVELRGFLNSTD